eukprot:7384764-Prymnesium_polylepis.2
MCAQFSTAAPTRDSLQSDSEITVPAMPRAQRSQGQNACSACTGCSCRSCRRLYTIRRPNVVSYSCHTRHVIVLAT